MDTKKIYWASTSRATVPFRPTVRPASVAQSDACPTGNQEVVGLIPAESSNILSWRLIMGCGGDK